MEESGLTNHGVGDTQLQQGILMGSPDRATKVQYSIIVQYNTVQYSCHINHGVGDTHQQQGILMGSPDTNHGNTQLQQGGGWETKIMFN